MRDKEREEFLAVGVSFGLMLLKGTVALWTGSLSLLASALDSLLDFLVSGVNLFSLIVSRRKPDWDHAFGHEKAEALAGLLQGFIILLSAGYLIYASFDRLRHPLSLSHLNEGIGVIGLSLAASLWLARRLRQTAMDTGSIVLKADAFHYATDLYSQGGILAALVLIQWSGWQWLDPSITIPISLYIGFQATKIGKEAVDDLMDRETSSQPRMTVQEIVARHRPQVVGMHNFKTRRAGEKRFIQFHVEVKRNLSFERVHEMTEAIAGEVRQAFGNVQVIVHADPEGTGRDESDK
jgi:ferrous-iron efflux pump FieF